ncbi:MAG: hypothetical protein ABIF19_14615 [Planctomycetota bacterium]
MKSRFRHRRWLILPGALAAIILLCGHARAVEVTVSGRITHELATGVYVDKGTDHGLRQGILGSLRLNDGRMLEFEVLQATRNVAILRLVGRVNDQEKLIDQAVELVFEQLTPEDKDAESPTQYSPGGDDKSFVPLLAPPSWVLGLPETRNIFHGQMRIRQMLQKDRESLLDYSVTHFGSSGSLDRIEGSGWNFDWSGDLSYRDGHALRFHPDHQEPRLDLYLASFHRAFAEGGFLRFGRFLPRELPGIGYVDGVQGQVRRGEHLWLGAVAGLKPDRSDLSASADEPLLAGYATFEAGQRSGRYYSGTAGLLGSAYEGHADRLALLVDQRAGFGPLLALYSTAEVDFDVGGAEARTGTRLTRLDVSAVSRPASSLAFRAGLDHWERPDNRAERDLLLIDDDRFFDSGYWRYWVGSDQGLPWSLRLSEEVSYIDSSTGEYDPHWRVGLTRTGLFSWRDASATATFYNLAAEQVDGYGGRFSAYLPFMQHKLYVQPVVGFRMLEFDRQTEELTLTYLSVRVNGRLRKNWTLSGGFTQSYGDYVDSTLLDIRLSVAW